jgi:hypothetical protein
MDSALEKWIHHWKNGFTIGKMDSPLVKWIPHLKNGFPIGKMDSPLEKCESKKFQKYQLNKTV